MPNMIPQRESWLGRFSFEADASSRHSATTTEEKAPRSRDTERSQSSGSQTYYSAESYIGQYVTNLEGQQSAHGSSTTRDTRVVDFDGPDDPEHPWNWSAASKAVTIILITLLTVISPIGSTIITAGTDEVLADLNSSNVTLGIFVTTVYLLGYASGPLVVAPLSELYGRTKLYHSCGVLFTIFSAGCALANNLSTLIILRFLAGVVGSCPITLGVASVGDLFPPEQRGAAMAPRLLGPILGLVLGPIMGGYITPAMGWRWCFWVMTIASGITTIMTLTLMRESYPYTILARKTTRLQKLTNNPHLRSALDLGKTPGALFKHTLTRPLKMLLSPIVFALSLYTATVYAYLYVMFTTYPLIFGKHYGFDSGAAGLVALGLGVGSLVGLGVCSVVSDRLVEYLAKRKAVKGGKRLPEYRLPVLILGGFLTPIGLFWYGWSAQSQLHWIVPIIGTGFLGAGRVIADMATMTYMVDAYTTYSASAVAASTILRSLLGALLPLAASSMYEALGVGWGTSVLGFIAVAFIPVPFILYVYGQRIRETKFLKLEY